MSIKNNCWVFLLLLFSLPVFSQEATPLPLKAVLDQVSGAHGVRFSFIEDEIVVYSVVPPAESMTLAEKLKYLERETKLRFRRISSTYYSIVNDSRFDKPLCGYVLDQTTGLAIENASVSITNTAVRVATDSKGYFELPKISPDLILIRHQSYEPKDISPETLYTSICPTIELSPMPIALTEVAAQRYIATGISRTADGAYVVKPRKFGILPGLTEPDVLQTMQQIPGIFSADESVSNLNVRGGTHDQNLFLWNGIRMFQTGHFFGMISGFSPSLAQNISIVKNGSPGVFGESVSSLVDISSHTELSEKSRHTISLDMISGEFYSRNKLTENSSLIVSGRRSLTDIVRTPTYKKYRERIFQNTVITEGSALASTVNSDEEFNFYDLTMQYQRQIGRHKLNIDGIGMRNKLEVSQSADDQQDRSDLSQQHVGGSVSLASDWNARFSSYGLATVSYYNLDSRNESIGSSQVLTQQNTVLHKAFRVGGKYKLTDNASLGGGYEISETGVTNADEINSPSFSRFIREVLLSHALSVEMNFLSHDKKHRLMAALRSAYFEKHRELSAEPRLQYALKLSESLTLDVLGERKTQTLSQIIDLQRDFLGIEKRRWTLANGDDIPVQKSWQLSGGMTLRKNKWLLSIENFYKLVDGITSGSQGFQNQFEGLRTTGSYRIFGTEALVQKNFGKFYSWVSYSFNNSDYDFDSLDPSSFPNNFEFRHSVAGAGIYEWKRLRIAIGARYNTGRPFTEPLLVQPSQQNTIAYREPNSSRLPDYLQVNFSATKDWTITDKIRFQLSASIMNLLDRRNVINRFFRRDDAGEIVAVETSSLGATPNINLKVFF